MKKTSKNPSGLSLFKIIKAPLLSEKSSLVKEKANTIVLKVDKHSTKKEIKNAVKKFFDVEVKSVNTAIVRGKTKSRGRQIGRRSDWKKAYVTLEKGQNLELSHVSE
jgi:large subunit ribosomal protein L23